MNKAITDGVVFNPTPFQAGLGVWSSGDGTPGSDTYANVGTAAFVPADQDFGGCLELQKTDGTQRVRYMGQTPLTPGCYLRITARVKAVSGNLPAVRVSAWAGAANQSEVTGVTTVGPAESILSYGDVVEVSAIVGSGNRGGVDMVWGVQPVYGHFGIEFTGPNGGILRVDDIQIDDVSNVFVGDIVSRVDVRDFGAVGNGTSNDAAAFEAADAAANGRRVFVPAGTFAIDESITIDNRIVFEGSLDVADDAILSLTKDFDLPTYIDAFGGDEARALKKALQSLLNNSDHESLDLGGRRVSVDAPIDVYDAVGNRDTFAQRRVIRNGQLRAEGTTAWAPDVVASNATYSASNQWRLTDVANIANIPVGSLVEGNGVGREIYVKAVNVGQQEITLSQPLSEVSGTQSYTFRRFKYLLDFSGFDRLDKFEIDDIEFQCNNVASGVMLPPLGAVNVIRNSVFNRPLHRGVTSIGDGCQGLLCDHNQFITAEAGLLTQNRQSVAINTNANDVKIRNNRASQFRHFAVVSGAHSLISGNHCFQGDDASAGVRSAGIVVCLRACNSTITGNYIDNCHIEWTNEREPEPDFTGGFGFAGLSVTNNVCLCSNVGSWFSFIVVKPFGSGHFVNGMNVSGNTFRSVGSVIDRAERVDESFSPLDLSRMRKVNVSGNTYHNVSVGAANPLVVSHSQNTHSQIWEIDSNGGLPFNGYAREIDGVALTSRLRNTDNTSEYDMPFSAPLVGPGQDRINLTFSKPVLGDVNVTIRMD